MKVSSLFRRVPAVALLVAGGFLPLASCNRSDDAITVYRIPKETLTQSNPQPPAAATTDTAAADVTWTAPSGWIEQPASGFRKASFQVRGGDGKTADVSVISFPRAAGGVLANVNRWRDQLKLAPLPNEMAVGAPIEVDGRDMFVVDVASEQPIAPDGGKSRILGGIFPLGGETWFFKMSGPDELVASQRDAFRKFLESVQVKSSPAVASAPGPMPGSGGGSTNAATPPPIAAAQEPAVQYTLPPNWQEKPLSPMRLASFNANAPGGQQVDVSVVSLPGMAGGVLANVNRWRDQVKLPPIDEAALQQTAERVQVNGHDFLVVDLANDKQRIVAGILDQPDRSWFVKMMGENQAVASQKSAFEDFLRSLKFP